jgi:predicted lipid-binding transport protein (Tim44 family)
MDEFLDIPTLIVIGVAIFVLFRLRSVLGTRTGTERSPLERSRAAQQAKPANSDDKVVPMRRAPQPADGDAERRALKLAAEIEQMAQGHRRGRSGLFAQELPRRRQGGVRDDRHGLCRRRPQDAQVAARKGRL